MIVRHGVLCVIVLCGSLLKGASTVLEPRPSQEAAKVAACVPLTVEQRSDIEQRFNTMLETNIKRYREYIQSAPSYNFVQVRARIEGLLHESLKILGELHVPAGARNDFFNFTIPQAEARWLKDNRALIESAIYTVPPHPQDPLDVAVKKVAAAKLFRKNMLTEFDQWLTNAITSLYIPFKVRANQEVACNEMRPLINEAAEVMRSLSCFDSHHQKEAFAEKCLKSLQGREQILVKQWRADIGNTVNGMQDGQILMVLNFLGFHHSGVSIQELKGRIIGQLILDTMCSSKGAAYYKAIFDNFNTWLRSRRPRN